MRLLLTIAGAAALSLSACTDGPDTADQKSSAAVPRKAQVPATPDFLRGAWFLGRPITMNVLLPSYQGGSGPAGPSDARPDLTVYVHGPIDESRPFSDKLFKVPTPKGERTLPLHENTLTRMVAADEDIDVIGHFVTPGPKATADTVHSRAAPADTAADGPLVYEIKLDGAWKLINSHLVIQRGLSLGLVKATAFDYGGQMWTTEGAPKTEAPSANAS